MKCSNYPGNHFDYVILGLSLFIDGVLEDRIAPQAVTNTIDGSDVLSFRQPLTIACSVDNDQCSSLKIHDLYYWDGIVEGIPHQNLGACSLFFIFFFKEKLTTFLLFLRTYLRSRVQASGRKLPLVP